ncbi:MAG TPA: outer membrane protein assembly factor BamD [Thermoanaerobaculia bacterium]|nr:outer membrane protein assembly factor BamD [Thermoanaerobaculia bacterium]
MRSPRTRVAFLLAVLAMGGALAGCKSSERRQREDPLMQLSAAESLTEGQRLMGLEKYSQARKYLTHAFEVEPNSTSGREALLLVADSLYKQGGTQNLVQAEAKYRDFLNRFPTSERAAYVQLQIGNSLAARVERPDRDQSVTRQAVAAFEDLLRLYPTSEYAAEAKQRLADVRVKLGEHEFQVARFYYRYGIPVATANRLNYLLAAYPEFAEKDKVYYYLGLALKRMGKPEEAAQWFEKLRQEFPQSGYTHDIPS